MWYRSFPLFSNRQLKNSINPAVAGTAADVARHLGREPDELLKNVIALVSAMRALDAADAAAAKAAAKATKVATSTTIRNRADSSASDKTINSSDSDATIGSDGTVDAMVPDDTPVRLPSEDKKCSFSRFESLDAVLPLKGTDGAVVSWTELAPRRSSLSPLKVRLPQPEFVIGTGEDAPLPAGHVGIEALFRRVEELKKEAAVLLTEPRWAAVAHCVSEIAAYYEKFAITVTAPEAAVDILSPHAILGGFGLEYNRCSRAGIAEMLKLAEAGREMLLDDGSRLSVSITDLGDTRIPALTYAAAQLDTHLFGEDPGVLFPQGPLLVVDGGNSSGFPLLVTVSPVVDGTALENWIRDSNTIAAIPAGADLASIAEAAVLDILVTASGGTIVDQSGKLVRNGANATFGRPYTKLSNGRHHVNFVSAILRSSHLRSISFDRKVAARLQGNPVVILLGWLGKLRPFESEARRLDNDGAFAAGAMDRDLWFIPGTVPAMCFLLEAIQKRVLQPGTTLGDMLAAALPSVAMLYSSQISGPSDDLSVCLEDTDDDCGTPPKELTETEGGAVSRGSLTDAVWELLSLVGPEDCTGEESVVLIRHLTQFFPDNFKSQANMPPRWAKHTLLLHALLASGAGASVIAFCSEHINAGNTNSESPLHSVLLSANYNENGATRRQVTELLKAGADPSLPDKGGLTSLCHAAAKKLHSTFVELVGAGAQGGEHTWALIEYRSALLRAEKTPDVEAALKGLHIVAARNRKVSWYFSWFTLLPSTRKKPDIIFETESFADCKVHPLAKEQLFSPDGSFSTVNNFGRRLVGRVGGPGMQTFGRLYLKVRPELPGVESAVRELARLLFGVNAMPYVELVRWSKAIPNTKGLGPGTPVLVSQGVEGLTLQDVIMEKNPEVKKRTLENFDAESVSEALILAILTMPEDGKPDNYVCEPIEGTTPTRYRLVGIDNDHAFAPPVAIEKGHKELKVKCCLFCLDQMKDEVAPSVREALVRVDAVVVIRDWLTRLKRRHQSHAKLFKDDDEVTKLLRDKNEPCALGVPFRDGAIKRLCDKFVRMQKVLAENKKCSHLQLLREAEPMLAIRYRIVLDRTDLDVGARFKQVDGEFFSRVMAGQYESMFNSRQMLSMNLLGMKTDASVLLQMLKGEKHGPAQALSELEAFAKQWKKAELTQFMAGTGEAAELHLLPASRIESLMAETNFLEVSPTTQQVLLDELTSKDLRKLEFNHCIMLEDKHLVSLIHFRNVTSIVLRGCLHVGLSFSVLHALSDECQALSEFELSDLPLPRRIARAAVTSMKCLEFSMLETVVISRCPMLSDIRLKSPKLRRISVSECPRLTVIDVVASELDRVDIDECDQLQERELAAFVQGLKSTHLGCMNVGLFGLDAYTTQTAFGAQLISGLLGTNGDQYWGIAKSVASVVDEGPELVHSVLTECNDPDVAWLATRNLFQIANGNPLLARTIIDGNEPDIWEVSVAAARVHRNQNNPRLAQDIMRLGTRAGWDTASQVAKISETNSGLAFSIVAAGQQVNWSLAKDIAGVATRESEVAEQVLSVGNQDGWGKAKCLLRLAMVLPEIVSGIFKLGATKGWDLVFRIAQVASGEIALAKCIYNTGKRYGWCVADCMSKFAVNDPDLTELSLLHCGLSAEDASAMARVLQTNTALRVLVCVGTDFGDAGSSVILATLRHIRYSQKLVELWLWDCHVGRNTAIEMGRVMQSENSTLATLKVRGGDFSSEKAAASICGGLVASCAMNELRLVSCKLGPAFAEGLGAALQRSPPLRIIELSGAALGATGVTAIARGLKENSVLTELYLSAVGVTAESASALGEALTENKALKILDVYDDIIGDDGCAGIAAGLHKNSTLTDLRLWNVGGGSGAFAAFGIMLGVNKGLATLTLSTDGIDDAAVLAIAVAAGNGTAGVQLRLQRHSQASSNALAGIDRVLFV